MKRSRFYWIKRWIIVHLSNAVTSVLYRFWPTGSWQHEPSVITALKHISFSYWDDAVECRCWNASGDRRRWQ